MKGRAYYRHKRLLLYKRKTRKIYKKRAKRKLRGLRLNKKNLISDICFLQESKFIKKHRGLSSGAATIYIPKVFSITNNPDETLDILQKIVFLNKKPSIREINIKYVKCKEIGIAASTIMDTIILELESARKKSRNPINFKGSFKEVDEKINALLEASGILKHLGFNLPPRENIVTLDLLKGSHADSGRAATKITDYFVECLEQNNFTLEREGYSLVSGFLGEILDNCSKHASIQIRNLPQSYLKWYALGHYYHHNEGHGECHLVIFNYGKTIYQGLQDTTDEYVNQVLARITNAHSDNIKKGVITKEAIWTLVALQEGISRLKHKDRTHGTGTITLLEAFRSISGNRIGDQAIMSITSGSSQIILNNKYVLGNEYNEILGKGFRSIAFNDRNDLLTMPDKENIRLLKNFFPGTIIEMKFPLDEKYITEIKKDKN